MYQKVRLRLTLLCTGITASIMIIMSLCYLYVSEQGLYKSQFQSFRNDINTITTNLEQQSVISMEWLSKMESQGNYTFFVLDNEIPFLYNQLGSPEEVSAKDSLLKDALESYRDLLAISPSEKQTANSPYLSRHTEYEFVSSDHLKYFGSVIIMERNSSALQIIVLSSLNALDHQILLQRLLFVFIDFAAILLLAFFSFIFTGKLLNPIAENQQKQTDFIAAASHELRTPLSVILSASECCKKADPASQQGFLKTIQKEGHRMSSLIDDMLTLTQSDSKRFAIHSVPTAFDTLLIDSYEAFIPLANEKSISLSLNLPKASVPLCLADPERISQVISILLHNAVSYTPENGKIELSLSYQKEKFYLTVKDSGIGISDEEKKKVFDRFYRAEKSRSTKGHFGLGLSIAYDIIKAHNGSIRVTDAEGGGAVFTVILPV